MVWLKSVKIKEIKQRLLQDIEKLRSPAGYLNAGHPRYNTLFGRDSLISAWQMLNIDPSIAKATLKILAKYQGKIINPVSEEEPGKILHEHRFNLTERKELPKWDFPYYGSIDSTPLFIVLATEYFRKTGDRAFILRIKENLLATFKWIKNYGDMDKDGYVEYKRKNPYGLLHQGWKDSVTDVLKIKPPVAIVEVQGYVYVAYQSLIFLASKLGREDIYFEALRRSRTLKENFNNNFWMEEKCFFALALDGEKKQRKALTSNPGHLLFTGLISEEKVKPIVSRLFKQDFWTPYGIRNHSSMEPDFDPYSPHLGCVWPHDNWIIFKGLKNVGFIDHADKIRKALLKTFKELGKIPEFYTVVNDRIVDLSTLNAKNVLSNPLQAWSSAGLLEMIWDG